MTDKEFVVSTLYNDFIKIAKVNIFTGEYKFVLTLDTETEARCLKARTIDEYAKNVVENRVLHPDDVEEYLRHTDIRYLQSQVSGKRKRFVHSFRRRIAGVYEWITFEIVVPESFSRENPWVVFTWKNSDTDTCVMEDSLRMLSSIYHKILKINITEDTYEIIKLSEEELLPEGGPPEKISEWLCYFADCGNVYSEDRKGYLAFTDLNFLRNRFRNDRRCMRFRYRRKYTKSSGASEDDGEENFRWVNMELLPSIEYRDDNQIIMLYIHDIHDEYVAELRHQKELEYYCNYDTMSGLWNRYYYNRQCDAYREHGRRYPVGAVFADMNRLKYINDNFGHMAGDEYLKAFSELLLKEFGENVCYRISGDEFVVLLEDMEEGEFFRKANKFYREIQEMESPMAAVGYIWKEAPHNIEDVVNEAEAAMYREKKAYYGRNPQFKR